MLQWETVADKNETKAGEAIWQPRRNGENMSQENTSAVKGGSVPVTENKMGTMPIGKLLFNMSLPMMVSMLVQALYNIVDSIFVAKLSENALTAVSLAFPLQTLLIAVGAGTGVGMNALLSRSLGEHDHEKPIRWQECCSGLCNELCCVPDPGPLDRKALLCQSDR